jgi:hypothetical protein
VPGLAHDGEFAGAQAMAGIVCRIEAGGGLPVGEGSNRQVDEWNYRDARLSSLPFRIGFGTAEFDYQAFGYRHYIGATSSAAVQSGGSPGKAEQQEGVNLHLSRSM